MKYIFKRAILAVMAMFMLTGCTSTSTPNTPEFPTTKQFKFEAITLYFAETHFAKIVYYTDKELEVLLNTKIIELLKEKNLLSNDPNMNKLEIRASYIRTYVGDGTPFPSDALRYPVCNYRIEISDNSNILRVVDRRNLTYNGGFFMNLQGLSTGLRDKKYELEFIEAFANTIVESIEKL